MCYFSFDIGLQKQSTSDHGIHFIFKEYDRKDKHPFIFTFEFEYEAQQYHMNANLTTAQRNSTMFWNMGIPTVSIEIPIFFLKPIFFFTVSIPLFLDKILTINIDSKL